MINIVLNNIRYFDADTPYHYTTDNLPLSDLENNDIALKAAIMQLDQNTLYTNWSGDWSTVGNLNLSLNLTAERGKPFCFKVKIWAIEDTAVTIGQASTYREDLVFASNSLAGLATIDTTTNLVNQRTAAPTLTVTYSASGENIRTAYSGYSGTRGLLLIKAERNGI